MKSVIIVSVVLAIIAFAAGNEQDPCYGVENNSYINNPESCSAYFYCYNGIPIPGECDPEYYFNYWLQICDWPGNVDCVNPTTTLKPETSSEAVSSNEPSTTEQQTEPASSDEPSTTEQQTEPASSEQPSSTEVQTEPPATEQPSTTVEQTEPASSEQPSSTEQQTETTTTEQPSTTDKPTEATTTEVDITTTPEDLCNTSTEAATNAPSTTVEAETTTEAATEEPFDPDTLCIGKDDGTILNNPVSCDAFFFCFQNDALWGNCPDPYYFNPELNICDHRQNVDCTDDPPPTEEPTTEWPTTEDPTTETSEIEGPTTTETEELTTSAPETEEVSSETPETEDSTTEALITDEPETTPPPSICSSGESGLHPHTSNCSLYIFCVNGQPFELPCGTGEHFSLEKRACVPRELANCQLENPVCVSIESTPIYFPHPHFCRQFFACFQGMLLELSCDEGDHWDADRGWCIPKSESTCVD